MSLQPESAQRKQGQLSLFIPYSELNWRKVVFLALLAYGLAFALRAMEIPKWSDPAYRLDGEYLLSTHDAYYWMAGAEGFGRAAGHPFSEFIGMLAALCGTAPANVGFWLPLFMGPLVAAAACIWAMVFGARSSGVAVGALACLAPGFLARTLLGYCDTDLVTLLFALLIGLVPAMWLAPAMRSPLAVAGSLLRLNVRSFVTLTQPAARGNPLSRVWLFALLLSGLFGYWARDWHSLFTYLTLWYGLLIPIAIALFSIKGERSSLWRGGTVYVLPLVGGLPGAAVALLVIFCLSRGRDKPAAFIWKRQGVLLLWLLALLFAFDPGVVQALLASVSSYLKSSTDVPRAVNATDPLVYPGVAQSIIEVQDLGLKELLFYFHPWPLPAMIGIIGFLLLLAISPAAAFHLPLIALSLLSIKLGGRMVMFGVASAALGMVVPVCLLLENLLRQGRVAAWLRSLLLPDLVLLVLLIPYISLVPRLSHGPIMNVQYAEALKSLREITPPDAVIWTWWDWGYATQYFALRQTIADGALHGGAYLYLPALVYSTDNPRLASQIINYTSQAGGPPQVFSDLSAEQAMRLLGELATQKVQIKPASEQYLVVSFDMLRLGYWIGRHGSWDFVEQQGKAPKINRLRKALRFNLSSGEVEVEGQSEPLQADSIDVLQADGLSRESYFRFNQRHFILNMISGDKLILDDRLYNALMTQLLISNPDDSRFRNYFSLVFSNTYSRVYKVD